MTRVQPNEQLAPNCWIKMASTSWQLQLHAPSSRHRKHRKSDILWKKRKDKKPPWDSTSSDLSVLKPTPEELTKRHQLHKPKQLSERRYLQQYQDLIVLRDKENIIPRKTVYQENVEQKKALIKEIFYNQEMELSNVLAETDKAMANVKDLFGDQPMKFKGIPHITDAPDVPSDMNKSLLAVDMETTSRLNALSESVMRHPAINDIDDDVSSETDRESDDGSPFRTDAASRREGFQSDFNFDYYKDLFQKEQLKEDTIESSSRAFASFPPAARYVGGQEPSSVIPAGGMHGDEKHRPQTVNLSCPPDEPGNHTKLMDLRLVLDGIDKELRGLETASYCGGGPASKETDFKLAWPPSLSKVLGAVVNYAQELTKQVETDRALQGQLVEDLEEQRALIDALTGDLICSQESNESLKDELEKLKSDTSGEIMKMKKELQAMAAVQIQLLSRIEA